MLGYPFTFYAANGMVKVFQSPNVRRRLSAYIPKAMTIGGLVFLITLGFAYLATPVLMNTGQAGVFVLPNVSAHFCSAPAVPYQDAESVSQALMWLDENIGDNSCVLVNRVFVYWGQLYLDKSYVTIQFWNDAGLALDDALNRGFGSVYFIWWNQDIGWFNVSIPNQFGVLRDFGRISVYEFTGTVNV